MNITIKKADISDIQTLAEIHSVSMITAFGGWFSEEIVLEFFGQQRRLMGFTKEIEKGSPVNYLVYNDDEPIGVLTYGPSRYIEVDAKTIELWRVYFLPGYWGQGAAKLAVDLILSDIKADGYKRVILWAMEENLRARRFYEKYGFSKTGEILDAELGRPIRDIMFEIFI
ncbi:MAG: GNAT family N-acetyltransferase [Clostridiales bacterium]|nr:GNAT family N-acetyltransferase [Clostridiales bacterium]